MRVEAVRAVIDPVVASLGLEVFDLTVDAVVLRLTLDREGGVDLDALTAATQAVSAALDAADGADAGLDSGAYGLEVSSPGLERVLRTPTHFRRALGATVSVKVRGVAGAATDAAEATRHRGLLVEATDDACVLEVDGAQISVAYGDIDTARTVFEWGPAPKPSSGKRQKQRAKKKVATR